MKYNGVITYDVACFALDLLEVDQYGLDKTDRRILQTLILNFSGRTRGALKHFAASIGEDSGTLEDVYEPYLLQTGFPEQNSTWKNGFRAGIYPSWISSS